MMTVEPFTVSALVFLKPLSMDLCVGGEWGGGEGGARAAIVNDCWRPLCLVEVC